MAGTLREVSSVRKLAAEVVPGEKVWHHGAYWIVRSSSPIGTKRWRMKLATTAGETTTWDYRRDYDVAVLAPVTR